MDGMYACQMCGRGWSSKIAAEDCADQDAMEEDDRTHDRVYGIHRSID